jgi:hypothetical protein
MVGRKARFESKKDIFEPVICKTHLTDFWTGCHPKFLRPLNNCRWRMSLACEINNGSTGKALAFFGSTLRIMRCEGSWF